MAVKPIPDGFQQVIPYLVIADPDKTVAFLKAAFKAKLIEDVKGPDGATHHAEVRIGDSVVMMGRASDKHKPMASMLYVYVKDVDATYKAAVKAGATSLMEPADQFYGDRNAGVADSQGVQWWIATRKENLSKKELQKRANAART